jgi:hypothetical protein
LRGEKFNMQDIYTIKGNNLWRPISDKSIFIYLQVAPGKSSYVQKTLKGDNLQLMSGNSSVMGTIKTQPAMFSNINTRNGHVDASQPV